MYYNLSFLEFFIKRAYSEAMAILLKSNNLVLLSKCEYEYTENEQENWKVREIRLKDALKPSLSDNCILYLCSLIAPSGVEYTKDIVLSKNQCMQMQDGLENNLYEIEPDNYTECEWSYLLPSLDYLVRNPNLSSFYYSVSSPKKGDCMYVPGLVILKNDEMGVHQDYFRKLNKKISQN